MFGMLFFFVGVAILMFLEVSLYYKLRFMVEFDQYLGFLAFLTILTIGFWLMIFLIGFVVPYWLGGNLMEMWKERREARRAKLEE